MFYVPSIFCAAAFVFLLFFMEETNYDRRTVGIVDRDSGTPSPKPEVEDPEKHPDDISKPGIGSLENGTPRTYKKKSFVQKLSITDKSRPQRMPYRFLLSLRLVSWPIIFYAGFSYGSYLIWFNVLNATASIILGGAPYHFSSSIVGLSYLACFLGVIAGSLFTGYVSDWMTLKLTRRNGGIFEPEQRLWGFALTTIVLPASLLLWGVGEYTLLL